MITDHADGVHYFFVRRRAYGGQRKHLLYTHGFVLLNELYALVGSSYPKGRALLDHVIGADVFRYGPAANFMSLS